MRKNSRKFAYSYLTSSPNAQSARKFKIDFPVIGTDGGIHYNRRYHSQLPSAPESYSVTSIALNKSRNGIYTQSVDVCNHFDKYLEYIDLEDNNTKYKIFTQSAQMVESDVKDTVASISTTNIVLDNGEEADPNITVTADSDIYSSQGEPGYAHIAKFLAKPMRVTSFTWASTAVKNDTLFSTGDTWTIPSAVDAWIQKLKGFQGLRATLCLKLVFNATPFSAGRVRMAYYPCGDDNQRKATVHVSDAIPFSQLPGVNIDCNNPSGSLRMPYVTPTQYYNLTENSYSWGSLYIKVVAPYRTDVGNAQSLTGTLWAWLEDVQLFGQTHNGIVTQSVDLASEKESRPISGFFAGVSSGIRSLSSIPLLKPYLAQPLWVTEALKGAAFSLGWSKPNKAMLFTRNAIGSLQNMANSTGERAGNSLALSDDAKLAPIDTLCNNGEDEMSINFIKSRWSYNTTFTMTTANVVGDLLYEDLPCPYNFKKVVSATENYLLPVAYLSKFFSMYRGGFDYEIVFCKTGYHKGQVQITFQPGVSIDASLAVSTYLYREIIDLETTNVVRFSVPYINGYEFLPCDVACGRMQIKVINPLQAPETVASTIDCLVYVRANDSLQFNKPIAPSLTTVYVTQSVDMANNDVLDLGFIGNSVNSTLNISSIARCGSEHVASWLQLLKRHHVMATGDLTLANPNIALNPYISTVNAAASPVGENINGRWSLLTSPFAFYRGSMEIIISESTVGAYSQVIRYDENNTYATSPILITNFGNDAITIANNINGGALIECPYYNVGRVSQVKYQQSIYEGVSFDAPRGVISFPFNKTTTTITQAAGDDFQLCFFVGIPRLSNI